MNGVSATSRSSGKVIGFSSWAPSLDGAGLREWANGALTMYVYMRHTFACLWTNNTRT